MDGLFGIEVEPPISGALELLRASKEKYGVCWPFQEEREIRMLRLMHEKHPTVDLESTVEGFMMWCMGDDERVARIKNWPQTLWTRVKNEERYRNRYKGGSTRSEVSMKGHTVVSDSLTFGW